ncbi:MAG TPA: hypothetical protein VGJ05_02635 [Fimbriiglobus sp.]|jgi:hypothetical protein
MPALCDPILRQILRDEALTRGLGDEEARMLIEWVADWTELLAEAAQTDEEAWRLSAKLCRRAKAIARFVALWVQPRCRGAATQLAAGERFLWPLPVADVDPADLMRHILDWENEHPEDVG